MIELLKSLGYVYDARFTWSAAALVALGVFLVVWALFPQRWRRLGRSRHVCPSCRYDLRGIARETAFPWTCPECGLEIRAEQLRRKPRPVRRILGLALLVFVAAHFIALWPQVRQRGWQRLMPSTALVLQPMDVTEWTDAHLHGSSALGCPTTWGAELDDRLVLGELWLWQEWLLLKRVERACRARDDYGITPSQYDMAVRLHTARADAPDAEAVSVRLDRLARSAGVPFLIEWERLSAEGLDEDDLAEAAEPDATVARALDQLLHPVAWGYRASFGSWEVTPEGVAVTGWMQQAMTSRVRIYNVSDLAHGAEGAVDLIDVLVDFVEPESWVDLGGSVNAAFAVADHLVVAATPRAHFQIEDLLDGLRDAIAAGPPPMPPYEGPWNPRAVEGRSLPAGLLDDLRLVQAIPVEAVRSAGPAFHDGVTEQELDACRRNAFGLLDTVRTPRP